MHVLPSPGPLDFLTVSSRCAASVFETRLRFLPAPAAMTRDSVRSQRIRVAQRAVLAEPSPTPACPVPPCVLVSGLQGMTTDPYGLPGLVRSSPLKAVSHQELKAQEAMLTGLPPPTQLKHFFWNYLKP